MQELIVISGKGGTGKTSLMAAFAALAENKVLCDADVDAADLHLVLDPDIRQSEPFTSG
ncbi:MAG: (4Fe-4S)-binding protein, partial [Desulfobacterales bacterium]